MRAMTVGTALAEAAGKGGTLLHDGDETIAFAAFDELTDRVAAGLLARGVKRGDRVGLLGLNTTQWLADYKVPRQFVITTDVPLTPVGKIHKALLKQRYLAHAHDR